MKKMLLTILALLLTLLTSAQGRRFSGTVTDPDGQGVIAAGVICKEKPSVGTTADLDGRFSLDLPDGVKTVVFSALGMESLEWDVSRGSLENVTVVLDYETNTLDKAVVTGYAQTTVKRITGSVAIIDKDKFSSKPTA